MCWSEIQAADTFIEVFVRRFRVLASFASSTLEVTLRADVVVLETHNIHMTARKKLISYRGLLGYQLIKGLLGL